MGSEVWATIQSEFSDIPDISELTRICLRLMMALILGGLLGYERESRGAAAGLRTHMLVSLGAAMFVLVPSQGGMEVDDLSRVLQGIIAGIGFLGAGTIIKLHGDGEIHGLTTAASVWVAAAVGIAAGMGRESTAVLATVFALFTLAVLKGFARRHRRADDNQPSPAAHAVPNSSRRANDNPSPSD